MFWSLQYSILLSSSTAVILQRKTLSSSSLTNSMRFWCYNHYDYLNKARASGYTLGHRTKGYEANERDLEDIFFRFEIVDGELTITSAKTSGSHSDDTTDYLSKFGNWEDMILTAFIDGAEGEDRVCPKCDETGLLIFDDEPRYIQ